MDVPRLLSETCLVTTKVGTALADAATCVTTGKLATLEEKTKKFTFSLFFVCVLCGMFVHIKSISAQHTQVCLCVGVVSSQLEAVAQWQKHDNIVDGHHRRRRRPSVDSDRELRHHKRRHQLVAYNAWKHGD